MKSFKLWVATLCVASLFSCHSNKKVVDESEYLKIGYLPSVDLLPYVVAQQQGIFDSLQLPVKLVGMENELNRDTLFQQKVTDGVILSSVEAFLQQGQGVSLVPVAPNQGLMMVVASADSTFLSLAQLRNRCLTVGSKSVSAFYAEQVLTKREIGLDELGMPSLQSEPLREQMLVSGQVDAAVLSEPYASRATASGCKVLTSNQKLHGLYSVLAFSDSIVQTRSPQIEQLLVGYNLAVNYMNSRPQREWLPKAAAAIGLPCVPDSLPAFHSLHPMQPSQVNQVTDWMKSKKMLPEEAAPARVNNALMKEAMKLNR